MEVSGILSVIAIVTSVGGAALAVINHKRIRSHCCGKELQISLDVENTTPPPKIHPIIPEPK